MRKDRAIALLQTLLLIGLVLVFALTLCNLAAFHYSSVQHQQVMLEVREGAQSALSDTVRQIANDPTFGTHGETVTGTLGNVTYKVSFTAAANPRSTNNLASFTSQPAFGGRSVPAHSAHILATASGPQGEHRTIEAVVHLQALNFPIESTGNVTGDSITVAGASSLADYMAGNAKKAASVYSGSNSNSAVSVSGSSSISGDVVTVGLASLAPTVAVGGKVLPGNAPLQVPNLNISSFDNSATPGVTVISGGTYNLLTSPIGGLPGTHRLTGSVYIDGPIHLIGPLLLDKASVYVAGGGDFLVDGPVLGQGSLFVTGKTQLLAGTVLQNDEQIAIFSEKDLSIPAGGVFQGVLYSHSKIKTGPGVEVLGAVIGQGPTASDGALELGSGAKIIDLPEYTAFASFWLAQGGGAKVKLDYWAELP